MGHHSSKEANDKKALKKSSRDIRLFVPDDSNNIHTVVVPKALLVENSGLFREMVVNGPLKKIKLQDVTVIGVLKALQYIENGSVTFENVYEVAETIKVAEKYRIDGIVDVCMQHLYDTLSASNACEVYEFALSRENSELIYKCLKLIDEKAECVLESEKFCQLKQNSVIDIIKRNSLNIKSEMKVFEACLKWGKAETQRLGQNVDDVFNLKNLLRPVLANVRFKNMSPDELGDITVNDFFTSLTMNQNKDLKYGLTSMLAQRQVSIDSKETSNLNQPRFYLDHYVHGLEVFDSNQASIANGETFHLKAEVLKGKVFLCGVNLALKTFSTRMNATCLYASLTATNLRTEEQKRVRGTFLDTTNESSLIFSTPLFLKDNDTAEFTVHVKMAGNVCPLSRKNDVEIVVPSTKDIAIKILPSDSSHDIVRCIFKDVIYFY